MKKLFICLILLFLNACAAKNPLTDFRFQTQAQSPYVLASWYKIDAVGEPLRVYIEGDGAAFNAKGIPTDNPTPSGEFMRELAAQDPNPNVAYLARPCQYLQTESCSKADWTTGRFSPKVVASMEKAVLSLMKKARTNRVTLIGYSGGAQIAGLIGVRHPKETVQVITIAGVLDPAAWTAFHGDKPLTESLNLAADKKAFAAIPQHHFVGGKDKVVPVELTQDFVADKETIILVPKATHTDGFEKIASDIYRL